MHVTLKLKHGLPSLRRKDTFKCLREAVRTARAQGFAVNQFAILGNHAHFILEPKQCSIGGLIQSSCVSLAKRLNRTMERKGQVFEDRYHLHVLRTPTEVRNALRYVLSNESRHRGGALQFHVSPYSSAWGFENWRQLLGTSRIRWAPTAWSEQMIESWYAELLVPPRTWLLSQGWIKARPMGDNA